MEAAPTTVKVVFEQEGYFGFFLCAKFLEGGYNVTVENCTYKQILNHKFRVRNKDKHKWCFHTKTKETWFYHIDTPDDIYKFHYNNCDRGPIYFAEYVIGMWGRVRGGRFPFDHKIVWVGNQTIDNWMLHI